MEKVLITVTKTDNGYAAICELLEGWVVTVTGNFTQLQQQIKQSIEQYIDWAKEDSEPYSPIFDSSYELIYKFDIQSLLCFYEKIFTKAALEHMTGINQKQLSHYACGRSKPRRAQEEKIINSLHELGRELLAISI
ncbi:MAG: hypothetical protein LUG51_13485 [Tannerellaceae bacterium]|nr:hypothetical protein [Tannerellaceae bacterium]